MDATSGAAESSVHRQCKSIEVACEANKLWQVDLKLCKQQLKVTQKQLARKECLIGAVETLTDALAHSGLVGRSVQKGKGKERVGVEVSQETSDKDADGEKEGCKDESKDGDEGDD